MYVGYSREKSTKPYTHHTATTVCFQNTSQMNIKSIYHKTSAVENKHFVCLFRVHMILDFM